MAIPPQDPDHRADGGRTGPLDLDDSLRLLAGNAAGVLVQRCRQGGWTIATAESLTGGLLTASISVIPGCGDVLGGGVVAYQTAAKQRLLEVPEGPVITAAAAERMVRGAVDRFGADVGIAVTGVAGPDAEEGIPVGTVFIAAAHADGRLLQSCRHFDGTPGEVRTAAVVAACELAATLISERP